ncbi:MAG: hypothetical protein J6J21_02255, partial [Clostridia bacterium]|nr:hypothetical protein [Clostridia bacterium]
TLRFDRGEKKDIVMINWQAHAAQAVNDIKNAISADYILAFLLLLFFSPEKKRREKTKTRPMFGRVFS